RDENDVYDIADYYQNDFGRKNSFSANMSQSLPEGWGSVSLSTLWRDYWGRSGREAIFTAKIVLVIIGNVIDIVFITA
ncbi:fimbria/pilus outer membrane usher protein, partial [Escherichia sp. SS-MK2]